MSEVLAKLASICSTDATRPKIASPFAMEWEGRKWAVGTDGRGLAALPFDGDLRTDGPDAKTIIPVNPPTHKTTAAALRKWVGRPVRVTCPECHGEATWDCDCPNCSGGHPCECCDGEGRSEKKRIARFHDGALDLDILRRTLDSAPDGELTVVHAAALGPFVFRAWNWIGLVMPRKPDEDSTFDEQPFNGLEAL